MKKILSGIIFIAVCLFSISSIAQNNKEDGYSNIAKKIRKIPSFDRIRVERLTNVYLIQGTEESIRIEADSSLHQYILTAVHDGELIVKLKKGASLKNYEKPNIYITFKDLNKLFVQYAMVQNIQVDKPIMLDSLKVVVKRFGMATLDVNCNFLEVITMGEGVSNITGNTKELIVKCPGGNGIIKTSELIAEKVTIHNSTFSYIDVHANKELDINGKVKGSIVHYGNAMPNISVTYGSKKIIKGGN